MKTLKNLILVAIAAVAIPVMGEGAYPANYQNDSLIQTNLFLLGNTGNAAGANVISNLLNTQFSFNANGSAQQNNGGGFFPIPPSSSVPFMAFALVYTEVSASNAVFAVTNSAYLPGGSQYNSATANGTWFTNGQTTVACAAIFSEALDDSGLYNKATQTAGFTGPTNLIVPFTLTQGGTNVYASGWSTAIAWTSTTNFLACKYGKLVGFQLFTTNGVALVLRDFRVGYPVQ